MLPTALVFGVMFNVTCFVHMSRVSIERSEVVPIEAAYYECNPPDAGSVLCLCYKANVTLSGGYVVPQQKGWCRELLAAIDNCQLDYDDNEVQAPPTFCFDNKN